MPRRQTPSEPDLFTTTEPPPVPQPVPTHHARALKTDRQVAIAGDARTEMRRVLAAIVEGRTRTVQTREGVTVALTPQHVANAAHLLARLEQNDAPPAKAKKSTKKS